MLPLDIAEDWKRKRQRNYDVDYSAFFGCPVEVAAPTAFDDVSNTNTTVRSFSPAWQRTLCAKRAVL